MSSIVPFPKYNLENIPECLRLLASKIEEGEVSAVRTVVILETEEGLVDYKAFGNEPFTNAHAIGLCHVAQQEILK